MNVLLSITVLLATAVPTLTSCAQDLKPEAVPQVVRDAFAKRFPTVLKAGWEMEDDATYEAGFKQNGVKTSACFDATGNWVETETEMKESALPEAVRKTLAAKYSGQKMEECELVETPGGLFYEVEMEQGETTTEVRLTPDGHVVRSQVEEEDDTDEKD